MTKRCFDLVLALLGLVILLPLLALIALLIKTDSTGPVFFRQERVGLLGKTFRIHKFRTMVSRAESQGPELTVDGDRRITRVGSLLRKYKLDELPQLFDVISGNIGPRPEVPRYVALYPPDIRDIVLSVKPGITDRASVEFRDESALLASAKDPHAEYIQRILPMKLSSYVGYARNHNLLGDVKILAATIIAIFSRHKPNPR